MAILRVNRPLHPFTTGVRNRQEFRASARLNDGKALRSDITRSPAGSHRFTGRGRALVNALLTLLALLILLAAAGCGTARKCCRDVIVKSAAGVSCPDDRQYIEPRSGGVSVCRCARSEGDAWCTP
jgi:hypothetical protein